jgi:hypothetical protein
MSVGVSPLDGSSGISIKVGVAIVLLLARSWISFVYDSCGRGLMSSASVFVTSATSEAAMFQGLAI